VVSAKLVLVNNAPHSFHLQPRQRELRPLVIALLDKHLKCRPTRIAAIRNGGIVAAGRPCKQTCLPLRIGSEIKPAF
jgi:hypothetical protein